MAILVGIKDYTDYPRNLLVKGYDRKMHNFIIIKRIFPHLIRWEAIEIKDGIQQGYEFEISININDDQQQGFEKLKKIVEKNIKKRNIAANGLLNRNELVGKITWVQSDYGGRKELIIDGKNYPMEKIVELLSMYEGWNFKLKIFDDFSELNKGAISPQI